MKRRQYQTRETGVFAIEGHDAWRSLSLRGQKVSGRLGGRASCGSPLLYFAICATYKEKCKEIM